MKRYSAMIALLFFLPGTWPKNVIHIYSEDSWSGDVQFSEIRIGPGIVVHQWKMGALISNDTGTATHSLIAEIENKYKVTCNGQGSSYLEVGIDEDSSTYSIFASVPGCRGLRVSAAGNVTSTGEDETGITINNQPLGTNRNSLRGTLVSRDTADETITTTTYIWNLRKN